MAGGFPKGKARRGGSGPPSSSILGGCGASPEHGQGRGDTSERLSGLSPGNHGLSWWLWGWMDVPRIPCRISESHTQDSADPPAAWPSSLSAGQCGEVNRNLSPEPGNHTAPKAKFLQSWGLTADPHHETKCGAKPASNRPVQSQAQQCQGRMMERAQRAPTLGMESLHSAPGLGSCMALSQPLDLTDLGDPGQIPAGLAQGGGESRHFWGPPYPAGEIHGEWA